MTLQPHILEQYAKGPFQPQQNDLPPHERLSPFSEDKMKEAARTQLLYARFAHRPEPQTFAESMRSQYDRPLTTHTQRAAGKPLVQDRIQLLYGAVPVVKEIQEPVATLLIEILCSPALRALEEDLQSSLGLSPDALHATLEFLTHLLSPHAP